ncbi:MAG: hypothetical protein LBC53_09980 [Spirochaetaceae bacterium]|jgi:hypothetical protein|nr:hypothetical protein [Spirochaetaceae bacterium]
MDLSNVFKKCEEEAVFQKISVPAIDSSLKTSLNRKGNALFNSGDVEGARRIFITTGYSDGLSRVGDAYKSKSRLIDALKMYHAAHDKKKISSVSMELAIMIKGLIREDNGKSK